MQYFDRRILNPQWVRASSSGMRESGTLARGSARRSRPKGSVRRGSSACAQAILELLEPRQLLAFTPVRVHFQPAAAPTVSGYLVDSGQTYAGRNGQTYGWSASHTSFVFDRNVNANQLVDTHVAVQAAGKWELAVPNGQYTVTVGVGDSAASSRDNVWVEGVQLFNYLNLGANSFSSKSVTVMVADGRLTVANGSAASGLTRINYVQVATPTSPPPTSPPPTSPPPTSPPPASPPPPPATGTVKVNFQPASAPVPSGYLVDAGQLYAARNGQTYGWTASHTDSVFDRNINADQRLDTVVSVKAAAKWELAVPNGRYTVVVSTGDAGAASRNNVWVEGVQLFNYVNLNAKAFSSKSLSVNVSDGRLTLGIGSAATGQTRINFVEVSGLPTSPPTSPPPTSPPPTSPPPAVPPPPTTAAIQGQDRHGGCHAARMAAIRHVRRGDSRPGDAAAQCPAQRCRRSHQRKRIVVTGRRLDRIFTDTGHRAAAGQFDRRFHRQQHERHLVRSGCDRFYQGPETGREQRDQLCDRCW